MSKHNLAVSLKNITSKSSCCIIILCFVTWADTDNLLTTGVLSLVHNHSQDSALISSKHEGL